MTNYCATDCVAVLSDMGKMHHDTSSVLNFFLIICSYIVAIQSMMQEKQLLEHKLEQQRCTRVLKILMSSAQSTHFSLREFPLECMTCRARHTLKLTSNQVST